ncbi:MAG: hypothetical protein AAF078_03490 [Planctomycetota bacterium]
MRELADLALYAWGPTVLVLFLLMPGRRAAITSFLVAWLFLPNNEIEIKLLPDYTKVTATIYCTLLGIVLFDLKGLRTFRFHLIDIPVVAYCMLPAWSSISGGFGAYDGLSNMLNQTTIWGMPYFIGRYYLRKPSDFEDVIWGIIIGACVYMPLCLYEGRMSPSFHRWVYGWNPSSMLQAFRFGGWRPMVFLQHGLMVGIFMWAGAVSCWVMWRSGKFGSRMWISKGGLLSLALIFTAIWCRSTGATLLGVFALGLFEMARSRRMIWPALAASAIPPVYVFIRTALNYHGEHLVWLAGFINEDRAASLRTRFESEMLVWRLLGGDWIFGAGRFKFVGEVVDGHKVIPDSFWSIALGSYGIVGLSAFMLAMTLPILVPLAEWPKRVLLSPGYAAVLTMILLVVTFLLDMLLNAMYNPIFLMGLGGLAGLTAVGVRSEVSFKPADTGVEGSPARSRNVGEQSLAGGADL